MSRKPKLELTWVGKEDRPRLEPRVLIDVPDLSHAAPSTQGGGPGITDNLLVQGDNLLALKALEAEYAGRVKCVFIDPPYNTGSAFEHYDDGLEHSIWLSMMRDRLEVIRNLLSPDGSLWVTLDDNEAHYFKVMADEVFGRGNFVANVIWQKVYSERMDARGFSASHDHLFVYSRSDQFVPVSLRKEQEAGQFGYFDQAAGKYYRRRSLRKEGSESLRKDRPTMWYPISAPDGSAIWPVKPDGTEGRWRWKFESVEKDKELLEYVRKSDGWHIYVKQFIELEATRPPSTFWPNIEVGHNHEAKLEVRGFNSDDIFSTPKPERLISRIIHIATNPGDLVLDSFAGSGTTGAVAHKMGRKWIMVEIGDHARTHIVPRLKKVIDGADAGGVTAATGWQGGGGFRFCTLGPSLIARDKWGREVISAAYDGPLLAQALCKIKGFRYAPSDTDWWVQGQSSDSDFLHVTTQTLSHAQLAELSELVGEDRSLLILCAAWRGDERAFPNLTIAKIPDDVLKQCDFGREDYGLPIAEPDAGDAP